MREVVLQIAHRRHALACLRRYAVMSRVISRYTAGKKDDQLVKEVEEAVEKVTLCIGQCDAGVAIQPVCVLLDSLCKWEEGGESRSGHQSPNPCAFNLPAYFTS